MGMRVGQRLARVDLDKGDEKSTERFLWDGV